ncbi:helix-turn-helix transcriptional regulator [Lacticaseibacillus zhaodongensis]|uniref:helix-turn-helix transcriptional regulator n=1 Tax=Lacticaseibacillus zhaodongensis TaxID=2668065 RepID=UPI0018AFB80F|nr:helix-turn-helix transcriptional regulator [Lacticaseibacillus zhaodongensis]
MNEKVLGHFLRYKREHVDPAVYSIVPDSRRRTPGLTRDEVASMAHVSVDWYTRIEQGRSNATPSADVLTEVCRVLLFARPEVEYVFNLLSLAPPRDERKGVTNAVMDLIESRNPSPAFVMNQNLTVLTTNKGFQQLYGVWDRQLPLTRNWVWRTFNSDYFRQSLSGWEQYSQYVTAVFRKIYSEDTDSKFLSELYTAVQEDQAFMNAWNSLAVSDFKTQYLLLDNPDVGELYLIENILAIPGANHYVVFEDAGDQATRVKLKQLAAKAGDTKS